MFFDDPAFKGVLTPILSDYPLQEATLYVVYVSRRYLPLKIRAFIDFVLERFPRTHAASGAGAAIGGAVGGGRGAGIGAASGGVLGGATGIANAQSAAAYAPQQFKAYYSQCMAARTPPPPSYGPPAYAPSQGYAPSPASNATDLNRQELNQLSSGPQYAPYSAYPPPSYPPRY